MSQSLLISQPVTNNLSNRCRSPHFCRRGADVPLGEASLAVRSEERWLFSQANAGVGSSSRELERLFHCPSNVHSSIDPIHHTRHFDAGLTG